MHARILLALAGLLLTNCGMFESDECASRSYGPAKKACSDEVKSSNAAFPYHGDYGFYELWDEDEGRAIVVSVDGGTITLENDEGQKLVFAWPGELARPIAEGEEVGYRIEPRQWSGLHLHDMDLMVWPFLAFSIQSTTAQLPDGPTVRHEMSCGLGSTSRGVSAVADWETSAVELKPGTQAHLGGWTIRHLAGFAWPGSECNGAITEGIGHTLTTAVRDGSARPLP